MSIEAMTSVWGRDFPDVAEGISKMTVRHVAMALADVVNDTSGNQFWGSRRMLAEKAGCHAETVGDVMKHLCTVGVLVEVSRELGSPVVYRWVWKVAVDDRTPVPTPPRGVRQYTAPPPHSAATVGGCGASTVGGAVLPPHKPKETQDEPNGVATQLFDACGVESEPFQGGVPFDRWWERYLVLAKMDPRPKAAGSKGEAMKAWASLSRAKRSLALASIELHIDTFCPGQAVPNGSTWLNKGRYHDDSLQLRPARDGPITKQHENRAALDRAVERAKAREQGALTDGR